MSATPHVSLSPLKAAGHQPAPEQQASVHRVVAFPTRASAQRAPRVLSPLGVVLFAEQTLPRDVIEDCWRRDVPSEVAHVS